MKHRSVEEAARNISLIFSRVKAEKKFFISVLPTVDKGHDALIRRLNGSLEEAAKAGGFTYIDLYGRFLGSDGAVDRSLFHDGVHPNIAGYSLLAEGLVEYLREEVRLRPPGPCSALTTR